MIRVTEVLDYFQEPELVAWKLREGKAKCERISQEALRIGEVVDRMIQDDVKNLPQDSYGTLTPAEQTAVANNFHAWALFKQGHPHFVNTITGIQTELTDGIVVGHPDLEITEKDRWGIVDIKTSKAIQPKHWTQVAAYGNLKGWGKGFEANIFLAILRLDKTSGLYEYKELTNRADIDYEIEVFQSYLTCYQHGQKIREVFRQQLEQETLDVA